MQEIIYQYTVRAPVWLELVVCERGPLGTCPIHKFPSNERWGMSKATAIYEFLYIARYAFLYSP